MGPADDGTGTNSDSDNTCSTPPSPCCCSSLRQIQMKESISMGQLQDSDAMAASAGSKTRDLVLRTGGDCSMRKFSLSPLRPQRDRLRAQAEQGRRTGLCQQRRWSRQSQVEEHQRAPFRVQVPLQTVLQLRVRRGQVHPQSRGRNPARGGPPVSLVKVQLQGLAAG